MDKKELIKKHLGINTEMWIVTNCLEMLWEFEKSVKDECAKKFKDYFESDDFKNGMRKIINKY